VGGSCHIKSDPTKINFLGDPEHASSCGQKADLVLIKHQSAWCARIFIKPGCVQIDASWNNPNQQQAVLGSNLLQAKLSDSSITHAIPERIRNKS